MICIENKKTIYVIVNTLQAGHAGLIERRDSPNMMNHVSPTRKTRRPNNRPSMDKDVSIDQVMLKCFT